MMELSRQDVKVIIAMLGVVGVGSGVMWWKQGGRFSPAREIRVMAVHPHAASTHRERTSAPLDLNVATAAELERVPGIGPIMARRIVRDRETKGRFARLEDLTRVKGVGKKTLAKWAPHVMVGSPP